MICLYKLAFSEFVSHLHMKKSRNNDHLPKFETTFLILKCRIQ